MAILGTHEYSSPRTAGGHTARAQQLWPRQDRPQRQCQPLWPGVLPLPAAVSDEGSLGTVTPAMGYSSWVLGYHLWPQPLDGLFWKAPLGVPTLSFTHRGVTVGASVFHYLLETSRVVFQVGTCLLPTLPQF